MEARRYGLGVVLGAQADINAAAGELGRPEIDILNEEERLRILELIEGNTWPRGWDGTEAAGDSLIERINRDGTRQPLLVRIQ